MINRALVLIGLLLSSMTFGQFNETIRSGRPGQSIGPYAVGKKLFQVQSGFELTDWSGLFNAKNYESVAVIRYGLTEKLEINSAWKYTYQTNENVFIPVRSGFNLGAIGCRINLIDSKSFIPSIGIQSTFKFPRLSKDFLSQRLATKTVLIIRQKLGKKFNLMTNYGLDFSGNSINPTGTFVFNLGFSLNAKIGFNAETYGSINNSLLTIYYDGSIRYLINPNFQLDLTIGGGKQNNSTTLFCSAGFSFRLFKKRSFK